MELASPEWNLQVPNGTCKSQMVMEIFLRENIKNVLEHLIVLAQHEPNQTYMEDDCEVAMKLFYNLKIGLSCPA